MQPGQSHLFSLHYSNSAVCRYSVLSYKRFIYTGGRLSICSQGRCWCRALRGRTSAAGVAPAPEESKSSRWTALCRPACACSRQLPALHLPTSKSSLQPARSYTPTALMRVVPSPAKDFTLQKRAEIQKRPRSVKCSCPSMYQGNVKIYQLVQHSISILLQVDSSTCTKSSTIIDLFCATLAEKNQTS